MTSRRQFVSEAFHSLNQPLTGLHCGLELSLLKQRSEQEYRQRVEAALLNAGAVLQLSKAVRELVEATDPGEDLQNMRLHPVLSGLATQLSVISEASLIDLKFSCPPDIMVTADPAKLSRNVGNLANIVMHALEPGGKVQLKANAGDVGVVVVTITGTGKQSESAIDDMQRKLDSIRIDTACSYAWTIGGEFRKIQSGFAIRLPTLQ